MENLARQVLTVNAGSSSIKIVLFVAAENPKPLLEASVIKIGWPEPKLIIRNLDESSSESRDVDAKDHQSAASILVDFINQHVRPDKLVAVGHRVVHGGPKYSQAQLITDDVLNELSKVADFDKEHMPVELELIKSFGAAFSGAAQAACFDTAFHHDLPTVARLLPIPREFEAKGVRRYGFHGLSYTYLTQYLAKTDPSTASGKVILAHLGNGASLAAVSGGKSIDTSMGFTPTGGVPMSTRSGDLDPGLALYLAQSQGLDEFNDMVNFKSGLLGVSQTSSDMEQLLQTEGSDPKAADAVDLFCYQVKKQIGAYSAALGGLDTLVFSGGIGENAPKVRARICQDLEFLGVALDENRNSKGEEIISADTSRVTVRVTHTDEAIVIASQTLSVIANS